MLSQLLVNGIIAGAIYALVALGFTIIYRTVKFFHFAHGVVYTVAAYCVYTFTVSLHINLILSSFLSIVVAALLGVGIEKLIYHPLRKRQAVNLVFLIASFGVFIFLQNMIGLIYGHRVLTLRKGLTKAGYPILGARITATQIVILVASLILVALLWLFTQRTKLGKAIRAVSDDRLAASTVGINPDRVILSSFAIGSALAGAAGILISFETNITPTMGLPAILKGIIASIIGGIGSIPGAIFGSFFLGLVENLGIWKISTGWKDAIAFGVLIVFLLLRPGGFFGIKTEKGLYR